MIDDVELLTELELVEELLDELDELEDEDTETDELELDELETLIELEELELDELELDELELDELELELEDELTDMVELEDELEDVEVLVVVVPLPVSHPQTVTEPPVAEVVTYNVLSTSDEFLGI